MKGAEEKRVIYDSLSVSGEDNEGTTRPGILVHTDDTSDLATKPVTSSTQKAYSKVKNTMRFIVFFYFLAYEFHNVESMQV